jgi:uroporphyrin-III C-methyltransferase
VVLYDALANEELLSYAPKRALKIFVGKEKDVTYTQDQINQLIVDNALLMHVVRLKGVIHLFLDEGVKKLTM